MWLLSALAGFLLWIIPTALIVKETLAVPGLQLVADLGFVLRLVDAGGTELDRVQLTVRGLR